MNINVDPDKSGEAVSWDAPGSVSYETLKTALVTAGLSTDLVKDMSARNAFSRAARELSKQRVIRQTREDEQKVYFQFTKEWLDDNLKEYEYSKECELSVNKDNGMVLGESGGAVAFEMARKANALLRSHMSIRLKRDVTALVQKIFKARESLLVRMRPDGGMYFVPSKYSHIADQVEVFLDAIGGRLNRFSIYIGDISTERAVSAIMADHFKDAIQELHDSINDLSETPSAAALEARIEKVQSQRGFLDASRVLLGANLAQVEEALQQAERLMIHKLVGSMGADEVFVPTTA